MQYEPHVIDLTADHCDGIMFKHSWMIIVRAYKPSQDAGNGFDERKRPVYIHEMMRGV